MLKKIGIIFLSVFFIACTSTVKGENTMLEEIYSVGNPKGFEEIHVENIVGKYIPLGISKDEVIKKLKEVGFVRIDNKSNTRISARHDKGSPFLNSDAKSIVIYFDFSDDLKLNNVDAALIKFQ